MEEVELSKAADDSAGIEIKVKEVHGGVVMVNFFSTLQQQQH